MAREVGNWLRAYEEYSKESESPESYHLWTALSTLASAVRRNLWLDQGIYPLYPNLYTVLVGIPGKMAKSTTIRLGRSLLYHLDDIHIGPDSVTREELINLMGRISHSSGSAAITLHSSELSSLIDPSGIKMVQLLTDLYDCDYKNPKGWRYSTKTQGKDTIKNPVINILAGTTPSWISEGMPSDVIGHGFTSRVIWVYEDNPRFLNPFPDNIDPELEAALAADLEYISRLSGQFTYSEEARIAYERRYKEIYSTKPADYRVEGYHWRKKNHLLKVAMLLSIAENDDMVLNERDIETAWDLLALIEERMPRTFSAVGKYEHASEYERILSDVMEEGKLSISSIYQKYHHIDPQQLAKIVAALQVAGSVKLVTEGGKGWLVNMIGIQ